MKTRLAAILIPLTLGCALVLTDTGASAKVRPKGHSASGYVNPFTSRLWFGERTDMGVDWGSSAPAPVVAIGNAVILGSQSHASWPGKHYIYYQLTDGSHAGDIIYVAEHLKNLLPAGTTVHAGERIATSLPGYPWTEWGWADQYGNPRAYPCYKQGRQTASGREMARFLISLGVTVAEPPGPGSDAPTGRRC